MYCQALPSKAAASLSLQDDVAETTSHAENILQTGQRSQGKTGVAENSCQVTFKRIAKVDVHWHVYLPVRPHRMIGKLLNGVKDDGTY